MLIHPLELLSPEHTYVIDHTVTIRPEHPGDAAAIETVAEAKLVNRLRAATFGTRRSLQGSNREPVAIGLDLTTD